MRKDIGLQMSDYRNTAHTLRDGAARSAFLFLASAAVLVASETMAAAQLPPEYDICAKAKSDPDRALAACSEIIRSGRATPHNLAITYVNRGAAWNKKG